MVDLDEKGYPVCDKSIEALSLIEEKILGKQVDMEADIYKCSSIQTARKRSRQRRLYSGRERQIAKGYQSVGKKGRLGNRYLSTDAGQD